MAPPLPILLIPGLLCSPRFFTAQLPLLWRFGPVSIADHTRDDSMAAIARRILSTAPRRFALAGHSMGGYVALEIMRQAAGRVDRLALLDTTARADLPEQTEGRRAQIALAASGRFAEIPDLQLPLLVHPARHADTTLRTIIREMAEDTGADAFVRQQTAIIGRPDSRAGLSEIGCPTLVLVGDSDTLIPPDRSAEMAHAIPGARLVVVPDCGHMCALEAPVATTNAMIEWLRG